MLAFDVNVLELEVMVRIRVRVRVRRETSRVRDAWVRKCSRTKCLGANAPTHLAELCSSVSESANRGHLRSAARGDLAVPRSGTTRYSQRCFAVSGLTLCNSLPLSVRDRSLTLTQLYVRLKTVLFYRAYETLA